MKEKESLSRREFLDKTLFTGVKISFWASCWSCLNIVLKFNQKITETPISENCSQNQKIELIKKAGLETMNDDLTRRHLGIFVAQWTITLAWAINRDLMDDNKKE